MDAATYLKRHGWRGDGHSLDHTGRGIRKPLLVSKKVDVLGVGLNKHAAVSDQWWMRAFDQGLKDLGTGKKTALADVREKGMNFGGLYGRFVKGEGVPGTFKEENEGKKDRKRKRKEDQGEEQKIEKKVKTDIKSLQKDFNRNVRRFVDEAVQRGLIPDDSNAPNASGSSSATASSKYGEKAVAKVFRKAGLQVDDKGKEAGQPDKYSRSKLQRTVKRVAKEYLLSQMSPEERQALESSDEEDKQKREGRKESSEEDTRDNEKVKAKEAKALKKREKQERTGAGPGGEESTTDEIKLAGTSKKKSKIIPEIGAVEKYPTKAEKKAKKFQSQTMNLVPGERKPPRGTDSSSSASNDGGFAVDTEGDTGLEGRNTSADSMSVIDSNGNVRYTCKPGQDVPLDPKIWTGIKPKLLPKPIRKARAEWMSQKRTARQARKEKKGKS